MKQKILNPKDIETATVQINCGSKSGTAFFIAQNGESYTLLTSNHNLPPEEEITLNVGDAEIKAKILERVPDRDVAIIQISLASANGITILPIRSRQIPYNEHWETFGFPTERVTTGGRYTGSVSRVNDNIKWDIDLECDQYNNLQKFNGLSGAALVIEGFAVGIIGYDNVGTLGATSIKSIFEYLIKNNISIPIEKKHSIPDSIENDIIDITPNKEVLEKINDVINKNQSNRYFLVSGSPGSGKTTIAAQLELSGNHFIIDRFFVKVPDGEEYPTHVRITPDFFMKWLIEVCYVTIHNSPPPKPSSEKTLNERISELHLLIQNLSNYYQQQGKVAVLVIDGLDDISQTKIEDYLSILPINLPSNIKVIFSCVSRATLPQSFQAEIDSKNEIKVTPLSVNNSEQFLTKYLKEKNLSPTQINELAQKSEGHPLYLRYLTKYVLELDDISMIDNWILSIPTISGEIENYYNKIWLQINDKSDETWLATTLSNLRVPVDKTILSGIVPEQTRHNFLACFKKIQHLLRDDEEISIYHTSFSDFVKDKTQSIREQVHKNISDYVMEFPKTSFGLSERVYHLANGNEQNKINAISECNQKWIDECALNSVNPDIVLSDVKLVIGIAAEHGLAHKVISLLLLSQRINFRYNILFNENAFFLVNALLALNKPDEAIRYVVRNKTLMIGDSDALFLLQRFYEYNAVKEAEILLTAINQTCHNILESGMNSDSFARFIQLKFSAVTLSSNSNFKDSFQEFGHIKDVAIKILTRSDNSQEIIDTFKDDVGSYNQGYLIWRFDIPPFIKQAEEEVKNYKFDDRTSGYIAHCIYQALNFQNTSPYAKGNNDNLLAWIEDLEYVVEKYGVHPDYYYVLLHVLYGRSKRSDIIEDFYNQTFVAKEDFNFRDANGVDLNRHAIARFSLLQECLGFLDTKNQFPLLPKFISYDNWEKSIEQILQSLCFIKGKLRRYEVENKESEINAVRSHLTPLIEKLIPNLIHRINWDRSYDLPEKIFPMIYSNLIELLIKFFPDEISILVEKITSKQHYQLGLYTEGYTEILFVLSTSLAKNSPHYESAFKIAKILEDHVILTIENRVERNVSLLRLIEIYGLLKNEDKAKEIFKEMINSSMGPSWYKEAQLGIINTTVSNITLNNGDKSYLQKFASHLHHASGEMTFQRYVKQQQEEFVGDLAKIDALDKSIEYFKYLLLPDYRTIILNAESGLVDMPSPGKGYVLGARAIEEQSGILHMLQNLDCKGSFIVWGLIELTILGDERYIRGYANIQSAILNFIEINESDKLDQLFKRISRFVVVDLSDNYRSQYLRELFEGLSESNFEKIKHYLSLIGMTPAESKSNEDTDEILKADIKKERDPLEHLIAVKETSQKKLNTENKSGARKEIIQALIGVQNQKYSIWSSNFSNKINDVRNLLSDSYSVSSEFIRDIKDLIINEPYFEGWVIASKLIELLRNIDDDNEKNLIISSVLDHIDLMLRTDVVTLERYKWLDEKSNMSTYNQQDDLLLRLLIWFLNHPSLVVKNRTMEILTWLGTMQPEIIVQALIDEISSDGYKISKELSGAIIHQISNLNPSGYAEILKIKIEMNKTVLLQLDHFMIKDSILSSLKEIRRNDIVDGLDDLIDDFERTYTPIENKNNGEIILEDECLDPIAGYIDDLNELGILNRNFANSLFESINKLSPLPIADFERADEYINRSFNNHNKIQIVSDYENLLRYALNTSISNCVGPRHRERVANILRFYQPAFPENGLTARMDINIEGVEAAINGLFDRGILDFKGMLHNKEMPINYFSSRHSESRLESASYLQLTSFLIPLDKFKEDNNLFYQPTISSNSLLTELSNTEYVIALPLFIKAQNPWLFVGSEIVPDLLNTNLPKDIVDILKSSNSVYWRRGRNWENNKQGVAEKMGFFTTITLDQLDKLKTDYKLIWQISNGAKKVKIDVFEELNKI